MVSEEQEITIIDFPQCVSTSHVNAQFYFERDVKCVQTFFTKRFGLQFEGVPILENDIEKHADLDKQVRASGCFEGHDMDAVDQVA